MRGGARRSTPQVDHEPDPFGNPKSYENTGDYIPAVTLRNVVDMPFLDMLDGLKPYLLERVPEGIMGDEDALRKVDQQIGRFANVYAYVSVLFGQVGHAARKTKSTDKGKYEELMAKKDALYRFLQALELKWKSCSRQVTIETESEVGFDRPDYRGREEKARGRPMRGWDAVRP